MSKLSLTKAAKEASIAKTTLMDALNSGRLSGSKNEQGHWEIEVSELFRVFPQGGSVSNENRSGKPKATPQENGQKTIGNDALAVEVKMLREQLERLEAERVRERSQLADQIDTLKGQVERQSADYRQALAVITDQRSEVPAQPRRSFWAALFGSNE